MLGRGQRRERDEKAWTVGPLCELGVPFLLLILFLLWGLKWWRDKERTILLRV